MIRSLGSRFRVSCVWFRVSGIQAAGFGFLVSGSKNDHELEGGKQRRVVFVSREDQIVKHSGFGSRASELAFRTSLFGFQVSGFGFRV